MGARPWGAFLYRDYRFLWATMVSATIVVWLRILSTAQWLYDETGSAALVADGVVDVFEVHDPRGPAVPEVLLERPAMVQLTGGEQEVEPLGLGPEGRDSLPDRGGPGRARDGQNR